MNRTVTSLMMGMLITVVVGIGASVALAHGGGSMMRGGTPSDGMGHMGMMGMGPGMMGHMGQMPRMHMGSGIMGMGPLHMLDLSDEQRAELRKIQDNLRKRHWTTMGKIMDEQSELRELFDSETPGAKVIGAVYGKIFDYRQQMIEEKIEAMNRMRAVLTKEQWEQLKQMRRGMRGSEHRGMRHGSGMDG